MAKRTLFNKVWNEHVVDVLPSGQTQLFVERHTVHEVTSPQAFEIVEERGLKIRHPELTFATLDHIIPTDCPGRPYKDEMAELMARTLEENCRKHEITYFAPGSGKQGVIHVTMPEQGLIWPGQVVVCGDSHTCTYGALGALSFGIGTTEVANVLATQTIAASPLKVRRINFNGKLPYGTTAKDLALFMINSLGVRGGLGFAYEYGGTAIDAMSIDERLTLCNMSVEGGARSGYVNPDNNTFRYLEKTYFSPRFFIDAVKYWKKIASGEDAEYDDVVDFNVSQLAPYVSWGTTPAQSIPISGRTPRLEELDEGERKLAERAYNYMGLEPGQALYGLPVDVVFIGSCTNGRTNDLREAAHIMRGRKVKVRTIVVPGSEKIKREMEEAGIDRVFKEAGAEWRYSGCSMCLAMNDDKVPDYKRCASTSNRNFEGRQGNPNSRTHLMSALTAAATAIEGRIADVREYVS